MNQLATSNGNHLAAAPQRNAFEQYSEAVNRNRIVGELLKFSKGDWLSGQDGDDVPVGTELVAAVDELMIGWLKWEDGKPVDMQMGRVIDGYQPAKRVDLGDTDKKEWEVDDQERPRDPWQFTNYLILKEVKGDQLYTFAPSSKGGIGAVGRLSGIYGRMIRQKPDQFPIVALKVDSYNHPNKAYGRIKAPVLEVVGWVEKAETTAAIAGEAAEAAEAAKEADDEQPADQAKGGSRKATASSTTRF